MLQFARGLQVLPTPKGENIVIITGAGGSGVLLSDACVDNGLSLMKMPPDMDAAFRKFIPPFGAAGNPVDITGGEPPTTYANTIRYALGEPRIHSLILGYWHTIITPPMVFAKALRRSCSRSARQRNRQAGGRVIRRRRAGGRGERVSLRARHCGVSVYYGVAGCGARREIQMGARGRGVVASNKNSRLILHSVDVIRLVAVRWLFDGSAVTPPSQDFRNPAT